MSSFASPSALIRSTKILSGRQNVLGTAVINMPSPVSCLRTRVCISLTSWKSAAVVKRKFQEKGKLYCVAAASPKVVKLRDGRKIAYEEKGVGKEDAKHNILVFHAMLAGRLGGLPAVSQALLEELAVRVVAIDRPGYGFSDPGPLDPLKALRHFPEEDLGQIIDALGLGPQPHVVTVSQGSSLGYAAACFAPDAIGNIAMLCPTGCIHWQGVPEDVKRKHLSSKAYSFMSSPRLPHFMRDFLVAKLLVKSDKRALLKPNRDIMNKADYEVFSDPDVVEQFVTAFEQSMVPNCLGVSHDMWQRGSLDWGFQLTDIVHRFKSKIHLWYGTEDFSNIPELNRFVKTMAPDIVELHELEGEGHVSFWPDEKFQRAMFASLLSSA